MKIALITEGITDQYIIKPIIENYFKEIDFKFNPISPSVDETDKQTGFGSWVNVIKSCEVEDFEEMLLFNDYVVIQIDTDVSHQKGFDVPKVIAGVKLEHKELCEKVIEKLKSLISKDVLEKYSEKFLFAIGIHSTECWLIATVKSGRNKEETDNCLFKLNSQLTIKNMNAINPNNKNSFKSRKTYHELARKFRNKKEIEKYSKYNVGFEMFVEQVKQIK
jgi:hypothetical protein